MEYIYGNPNKAHLWENVVSIFAAHDSLNSTQTSSLPLVQFWRASGQDCDGKQLNPDAQELLKKFLGENGTDKDAQLCFEYAVPVHCKSGRGKASMTDLMILTKTHTIALEAKWTECHEPYQTITDWFKDRLKKGSKQENLVGVLNGWIKYINEYLSKEKLCEIAIDGRDNKIIPDHYQTVPYQLLHRIASACAEAKNKKATVIYQLFYSDENSSDDEGWVVVTKGEVEEFAKKLRTAFETLFKGFRESEPIQFSIMITKVSKGEGFDAAIEKCKKSDDLNELFLEMQKSQSPIYTFPESSIKLFPFDQK